MHTTLPLRTHTVRIDVCIFSNHEHLIHIYSEHKAYGRLRCASMQLFLRLGDEKPCKIPLEE